MRRALVGLASLALGACNPLYGLDETHPLPDGPPPADDDRDGIPDLSDNCVGLANADQLDHDEDGVGDLCDNCPLVVNELQEHAGDADDVGDACDPHPEAAGDCLLVLDGFSDQTGFAGHWSLIGDPAVAFEAGAVLITPRPGTDRASAVALDDQGQLYTGVFDTQLLARYAPAAGGLYAMSNISVTPTGYGCGLTLESLGRLSATARSASATYGVSIPNALSTDPVDTTTVLLRLTAPFAGDPHVVCRLIYGLAVGVATVVPTSQQTPTDGAPGVMLDTDPARLDAFALYRSQTAACPAPSYR